MGDVGANDDAANALGRSVGRADGDADGANVGRDEGTADGSGVFGIVPMPHAHPTQSKPMVMSTPQVYCALVSCHSSQFFSSCIIGHADVGAADACVDACVDACAGAAVGEADGADEGADVAHSPPHVPHAFQTAPAQSHGRPGTAPGERKTPPPHVPQSSVTAPATAAARRRARRPMRARAPGPTSRRRARGAASVAAVTASASNAERRNAGRRSHPSRVAPTTGAPPAR